jgi:hypothetical protein
VGLSRGILGAPASAGLRLVMLVVVTASWVAELRAVTLPLPRRLDGSDFHVATFQSMGMGKAISFLPHESV